MKTKICSKCNVHNPINAVWCTNCDRLLSKAEFKEPKSHPTPEICWYCETRKADGHEWVYVHRSSGYRESPGEMKTYWYYENKSILIPRCLKCPEEKESINQLRMTARGELKAKNPRPKTYILYLLGILLGFLAPILIVKFWEPGIMAVLPIILAIFCLGALFISIEKYSQHIDMLVIEQIEEYKATHGILYQGKDPKTFPEVAALLDKRWSYGHAPGIPVSEKDLPLPREKTK